jgi:hypothetical protein
MTVRLKTTQVTIMQSHFSQRITVQQFGQVQLLLFICLQTLQTAYVVITMPHPLEESLTFHQVDMTAVTALAMSRTTYNVSRYALQDELIYVY